MPRRSRTNWPLLIGLAVFFVFIGSFIAWPLIFETVGGSKGSVDDFALPPPLAQRIRERAMTAVSGVWFFVFGATIGSFLNVVASRMPIGLTFVSKPSRCPYCETPILFKHNVPILGWFVLRGRCSACRLPISLRYLLVELLVGVMFFTLFCAELVSGGRNLPIRVPNSRPGVMWNLFTPQWDLIGFYAFHSFLLGVLATIALIKFDRLRIPFRLVMFSFAVGMLGRVVWPYLGVLPPIGTTIGLPARVEQPIADLVFGVVFGVVVQFVIKSAGKHRLNPSCCGSVAMYGLVAVYLGWQATIPMLLIASLAQLFAVAIGYTKSFRTSRFWGLSALVAAWLTICLWRQLPSIWLPGTESKLAFQVCAVLLGLISAWVAESLAIQQPRQSEDEGKHPNEP